MRQPAITQVMFHHANVPIPEELYREYGHLPSFAQTCEVFATGCIESGSDRGSDVFEWANWHTRAQAERYLLKWRGYLDALRRELTEARTPETSAQPASYVVGFENGQPLFMRVEPFATAAEAELYASGCAKAWLARVVTL